MSLRSPRRGSILAATALLLLACVSAGADPLPSWRDGSVRDAILTFVGTVTEPGTPDYVPPDQRIAVLGHEGVLVPEQPLPQGVFTLRRLQQRSDSRPEWREKLPFRGALTLRDKYFVSAREDAALTILAASHAGLAQEEYRAEAAAFWRRHRHPVFGVPFARTGYVPMHELIELLRANGFRVFIVTAADIDFVRPIARELHGIPPSQVIGTRMPVDLIDEADGLALRRIPGDFELVDGERKVLEIDRYTGGRPIFVAGRIRNGSDIAMLRMTPTDRPAMALLLQHDDWEREFAYDEADEASLEAAARYGWTVVSMRWHWRRIFEFDREPD